MTGNATAGVTGGGVATVVGSCSKEGAEGAAGAAPCASG